MRRLKIISLITVLLLAIGIGGHVLGRNYTAQIDESGKVLVQETLQRQINATCHRILESETVPIVETKQDNEVKQIAVDAAYMNKLAAECNTQCEYDLDAYDALTISVPRGALIGGTYLSDKGRLSTYTMAVSYDLTTQYKTVCEAVGINQIRYAVYLMVEATAHVTVPMSIQDVRYTYYVPVCEMMYAADVPNVYVADENGTNYLDLLP